MHGSHARLDARHARHARRARRGHHVRHARTCLLKKQNACCKSKMLAACAIALAYPCRGGPRGGARGPRGGARGARGARGPSLACSTALLPPRPAPRTVHQHRFAEI